MVGNESMDCRVVWCTAFLGKIAAEWYRYVGRMSGIEEEMTADRPTKQRGLDRVQEIDDRLPAGVTLEERSDT